MRLNKRILCFSLALLLLSLAACRPSKPVEVGDPTGTTAPAETTRPTETTVPTQTATPTQTTTPPTTAPVETTIPPTQPTVEMTDDQYAMSPDDYYTFVFDGIRQPIINGPEFDLSTLTAGCLYVYDENNGQLTQLSEKTVICRDSTCEHIYYLVEDSKQIIRSDYAGNQQEVIYTSETPITWFDYYGVNAKGKLCVVEDYNRVILFDFETGNTETLMEQYYIEEAYYDADSLGYTSPDKGVTILWHGKVSESDEFNTYLYYVETGELEDPVWH